MVHGMEVVHEAVALTSMPCTHACLPPLPRTSRAHGHARRLPRPPPAPTARRPPLPRRRVMRMCVHRERSVDLCMMTCRWKRMDARKLAALLRTKLKQEDGTLVGSQVHYECAAGGHGY